jgi:hypothetical protein
MKYRDETIPKSTGQLRDRIGDTMLRAPKRNFPDSYDFDGTFYSMCRGVDNLRGRFGDAKANQLLEMLAQAKAHYEADDNKLGGALMEDAKMVVMGRQPWAYPKELYRWAVDSSLPEVSEADLSNKGGNDGD